MSWRGRPQEIGGTPNCPHCATEGIRKPNACKRHSYAYRRWYESIGKHVWDLRDKIHAERARSLAAPRPAVRTDATRAPKPDETR